MKKKKLLSGKKIDFQAMATKETRKLKKSKINKEKNEKIY